MTFAYRLTFRASQRLFKTDVVLRHENTILVYANLDNKAYANYRKITYALLQIPTMEGYHG